MRMKRQLDVVSPVTPDPGETGPAPARPPARPARGRSRYRWPLWLALAALLAAAGWYWQGRSDATVAAPATAPAVRGSVEESVLAIGTLKPDGLVAVGAQVSGRITRLAVALGDRVTAGDVVAEIDPATRTNDLRTTEASLAGARADRAELDARLALAERTLERQQRLATAKTISEADLDTADNAVAVLRAQIAAMDARIAAAEVAVENARVNLGYTRVTAPIDGTVLAVVAQQGQTVLATQSTPTIVILGELGTMTVHADVSEADVVKVAPGQEAWFSILGEPERRYPATLTAIAPAPETITDDTSLGLTGSSSGASSSSSTQAIYYDAVFRVPNAEGRLRTYMTAEVHIILDRAEDVLTIPAVALGARGDDGTHLVRVLEPSGQIVERRVTVGLNDRVTAEIRSGLDEGDEVVLGGNATGASAVREPRMPRPMGL